MTRRDLLALVIVAAGVPAFVYSILRPPTVALRQLRPRFRRRRLTGLNLPMMKPGAYVNTKSGVVHAFDAKGRLIGFHAPRRDRKKRVSFEWMKRLQPIDLRNPGVKDIVQATPVSRVSLHASPAMF